MVGLVVRFSRYINNEVQQTPKTAHRRPIRGGGGGIVDNTFGRALRPPANPSHVQVSATNHRRSRHPQQPKTPPPVTTVLLSHHSLSNLLLLVPHPSVLCVNKHTSYSSSYLLLLFFWIRTRNTKCNGCGDRNGSFFNFGRHQKQEILSNIGSACVY